MATVAVFVALGGTSYAVATGSIDSREIKNNSVRSGDLRNNNVRGGDVRQGTLRSGDVADGSLLEEDFKAGELPAGPRGATGAQGATGTQGATGAQGTPGVSGLDRVFGVSTNDSNSAKVAVASCPAGKRAIGSGADIGGGNPGAFPNTLTDVALYQIIPSDENTVPGNVVATAVEEEPHAGAWFVRAWAVCANVS